MTLESELHTRPRGLSYAWIVVLLLVPVALSVAQEQQGRHGKSVPAVAHGVARTSGERECVLTGRVAGWMPGCAGPGPAEIPLSQIDYE